MSWRRRRSEKVDIGVAVAGGEKSFETFKSSSRTHSSTEVVAENIYNLFTFISIDFKFLIMFGFSLLLSLAK